MQNDEDRPPDSSEDPKTTNAAQDAIEALIIGVQARTRGMETSAARRFRIPVRFPHSITVALTVKFSGGAYCNDTAWHGPDGAVSILTIGWSGQDCREAAIAAGIAVV